MAGRRTRERDGATEGAREAESESDGDVDNFKNKCRGTVGSKARQTSLGKSRQVR